MTQPQVTYTSAWMRSVAPMLSTALRRSSLSYHGATRHSTRALHRVGIGKPMASRVSVIAPTPSQPLGRRNRVGNNLPRRRHNRVAAIGPDPDTTEWPCTSKQQVAISALAIVLCRNSVELGGYEVGGQDKGMGMGRPLTSTITHSVDHVGGRDGAAAA